MNGQPELLAPAGRFETALAAFEAGADAVYLGLSAFSARASAVNFTEDELANLIAFARRRNRKVYVTFNVLLEQAELPDAVERLARLEDLAPDGLIVQDLGVARLVRRHFPSLALHASTQLVAHDLEGVLALEELGFSRVVLARELPVAEVASIAKRCRAEIEVFVHGALCYSLSGLCLFSAMERGRSGNRGRCAYCCRLPYSDAEGRRSLPFSMRDLRLDDYLGPLAAAGVASLKIEGRMKSSLYVASVVKRYRELLDGAETPSTTRADLETVFSRRTTSLYAGGYPLAADSDLAAARAVIDPDSLGHLGAPIGTIRKIVNDRDGSAWARFVSNRALERHDGLQFAAPDGGKPLGFGISGLRLGNSRKPLFETAAGADVEVLLTGAVRSSAVPGATVYCSASNEVRRRFPVPSFRPSDCPAGTPFDASVALSRTGVTVEATGSGTSVSVRVDAALGPARHPERTPEAVRSAFGKTGGSGWVARSVAVLDPEGAFAPVSLLNDARRALVAELDAARNAAREAKIAAARETCRAGSVRPAGGAVPRRSVKVRADQLSRMAAFGSFDELVVAVARDASPDGLPPPAADVRLALPAFTRESDCPKLRALVKRLVRAGWKRWEAGDLAGVRLLKASGVTDLTTDWTAYAFNSVAADALGELGVTRVVASPECGAENAEALARAGSVGVPVTFLERQTTPLFLSLTRPAAEDASHFAGPDGVVFASFRLGDLWVTAREEPRAFAPPAGACVRADFSWDRP